MYRRPNKKHFKTSAVLKDAGIGDTIDKVINKQRERFIEKRITVPNVEYVKRIEEVYDKEENSGPRNTLSWKKCGRGSGERGGRLL